MYNVGLKCDSNSVLQQIFCMDICLCTPSPINVLATALGFRVSVFSVYWIQEYLYFSHASGIIVDLQHCACIRFYDDISIWQFVGERFGCFFCNNS